MDTVILGCTHYPLIRPMLQRMLGRGVAIVTSGAALARQVEHALSSRGLANPGPEPQPEGRSAPSPTRATTASSARATPRRSARSGTRFLQLPLGPVEHVDLRAEVPA